jgi:hypothetical protein
MSLVREEETLASIRFFIKGDARLETMLKAKLASLAAFRNPLAAEIEAVYKDRCLQNKIAPRKLIPTADEIRLTRLVPERTSLMKGSFDSMGFAAKRREMKDAPTRSVLQIRNAVSAELSPVGLKDVENLVLVLEKAGFVTIRKK